MRYLRSLCGVYLLGLCALPLLARADQPSVAAIISCGNSVPGGIHCFPSKKDLKEARTAYARGVKLAERKEFEEAFVEFDNASRSIPDNLQFFSAREGAKAQLVFQRVQRGDVLLSEGQVDAATAEFRLALELEPDNDYLASRLAEAQTNQSPADDRVIPTVDDSVEVQLQPSSARASFHYRGEVRELFKELAAVYGIAAEFDDSVQSDMVRFYVDDVDFFTAIRLACRVSKNMWTPLRAHQVLIAASTANNHKRFDRLLLATFRIPGAGTPVEAAEMTGILRSICDFQQISSGQSRTLEVRAPGSAVAACAKLMRQLDSGPPQVAIEVDVYRIDHNFARETGMHVPDTFTMYNLASVESVLSGGQSIATLEQELTSGNTSSNSALTALLTQLETQTGIFSSPLATFGGGITYSGISLDRLSVTLSVNESWSQSLSHTILRTTQGKEATLRIGERYPILNASYSTTTTSSSSLASSSALSSLLNTQSSVTATPSVSYEDIGLSLKVTPAVRRDGVVSLKIGLQLQALTGSSSNGIPLLSNEQYQGSALLQDGEAVILAGQVTTNDTLALSGIPGLSYIAGLNQAVSDHSGSKENDELLIIVTPHVTAAGHRVSEKIWVTDSPGLGLR
jgi:general secretion pathway protein D